MAAVERARLLLHWVNSLPLTNCLLVDDLADLRFGDVLADIARWVQVTSRIIHLLGLLLQLTTLSSALPSSVGASTCGESR